MHSHCVSPLFPIPHCPPAHLKMWLCFCLSVAPALVAMEAAITPLQLCLDLGIGNQACRFRSCHDFPYLSTAASISLLFTYTCCWCEHLIALFMPAIQLLRLHCLIVMACIMTLIALPHCYLMTQTCLPVYKDPISKEKSLKLVLLCCILRLNIVALHNLPAWVLLGSYWTHPLTVFIDDLVLLDLLSSLTANLLRV